MGKWRHSEPIDFVQCRRVRCARDPAIGGPHGSG